MSIDVSHESIRTEVPCCICGRYIYKIEGHNPWPVRKEGVCCMDCNMRVVIPTRIRDLDKLKSLKEDNHEQDQT